MGKANDVHVVKDFKINIDSLCCVGNNMAAEHVQLLKICAQQLMICNVCYFYFSPSVYCVHVRIVLLYWFIKHDGNKQVSGSNWMLSCVG